MTETPLPAEIRSVLPQAEDYFVEEVKQQLLDDVRLGETREEREYAVFRGGLQIHTTLDPIAQIHATVSRNDVLRSEEHTSELQSLMRNTYAVFCLKKKKNK